MSAITNGVKCPEDLQNQIVAMGANGYTTRDIALEVDVSHKTVANILNKYGSFKQGFLDKLKVVSGAVSMQYGLMAFHELTQRMLKGEKVQSAQLGVLGGIALSRGRELLENTNQVAPPDWSQLNQNVDSALVDTDSPIVIQAMVNSPSVQAD